MEGGRLKGVHIILVPHENKNALLNRFVSSISPFVAIDFDCSLPHILKGIDSQESIIILEEDGILQALSDVYTLVKQDRPIIINSLNTLKAMAKVSSNGKEWSRRYFKQLIYLTIAGRARSDLMALILHFYKKEELKSLQERSWFKPYESLVDGIWLSSIDGLNQLI